MRTKCMIPNSASSFSSYCCRIPADTAIKGNLGTEEVSQ